MSQLEKNSIFKVEWLYPGIAHIILIVRAFFGIVVAKQSCQQSKKQKRATPPYLPLPAQRKAEKVKNADCSQKVNNFQAGFLLKRFFQTRGPGVLSCDAKLMR